MSRECPCGTSVGTRAHWCEWEQEQHALRMERMVRFGLSIIIGIGLGIGLMLGIIAVAAWR